MSSHDQSLERQELTGAERVFEEKASAAGRGDRPKLKELIEFAREGDTVLVHSIDRLQLQLMGAFAEFERAMIRRRQAAGIARAKERGAYRRCGRARLRSPAGRGLVERDGDPASAAAAGRIAGTRIGLRPGLVVRPALDHPAQRPPSSFARSWTSAATASSAAC